jgi:hypothetical protein
MNNRMTQATNLTRCIEVSWMEQLVQTWLTFWNPHSAAARRSLPRVSGSAIIAGLAAQYFSGASMNR